MENKDKHNESLITELAFNLVADSEESEGFGFNLKYVDARGTSSIAHINKETILGFLKDDYTKVSIMTDKEEDDYEISYLLAHNSLSGENVKIYGLKDHYLALLEVVYKANEMYEQLKQDNNVKLLSHEFIKHVNVMHQHNRRDEVGIANYRLFKGDAEYQKLYGQQPHEVYINSYINDKYTKVSSLNLAKSEKVEGLMTELIDWVNNVAFKDGRDVMNDIAEFHSRFIKIHPFGDGNGRTARLLTNYLLLALGQSMITIPVIDKDEYCNCINYAISEDLELTSRQVGTFSQFLLKKYGKDIDNGDFSSLNSKRDNGKNRYCALADFFRQHQVSYSADNCFKQILNNYGMKNINERINIGKISAEIESPENE